MIRLVVASLLAVLVCTNGAIAQSFAIEPSHTRAQYRISHLGFSMMPGMFNDIAGTIDFNAEQPGLSKVDAVIQAKSVTMNNAALDEKLLGKEFFNVEKYPTITFKSTSVERIGSDKGKIKGDLTLLGVTKPVTLTVKLNKKGWNRYVGEDVIGFTAWGEINRSDFGMKAYLPDVGDKVFMRFDVEAVRQRQVKDATTVPTTTPKD